jgi:hypothetical protein
VQVDQTIPDITPRQAKNAWLSYQWEQGGGLMVRVKQDSELERTLVPFGIQETLLSSRVDEVRYRMTELGVLRNYLIENSHQASVEFIEEEDYSTTLVWIVEFEAKTSWDAQFWAYVTEVNIKAILENLDTYLSTPQLYRRTTRLCPKISADNLVNEWIDFVWKQGGGLPLPSPQELDDERRMIVPPFLVERLVDVEPDEVCYTVDNPGFFTYQVLTHKGRVRFEQDKSGRDVKMMWEVEIRPFRGWAWIVEPFTAAVITTLARNFKVHVNEPGATVKLFTTSRGDKKQGKNNQGSANQSSFSDGERDIGKDEKKKGISLGNAGKVFQGVGKIFGGGTDRERTKKSFGVVRKDTWLGRVLDARQKKSTQRQADTRDKDQQISLGEDESGEGGEWVTGYMSDYYGEDEDWVSGYEPGADRR